MYNLLLIYKFQSDKFSENAHDVSLKKKTSVEDDEIFDLFEFFKEEQQPHLDLSSKSNSKIEVVPQNQVKEVAIIENGSTYSH